MRINGLSITFNNVTFFTVYYFYKMSFLQIVFIKNLVLSGSIKYTAARYFIKEDCCFSKKFIKKF